VSTAVTAARTRDVTCPECGDVRTVSLNQAWRIDRGDSSAKCALCRRPAQIRITEQIRRDWLTYAGVPVSLTSGRGGATRYVRQHGLPEPLQAIAAGAAWVDGMISGS
jgi:hypothetical protein